MSKSPYKTRIWRDSRLRALERADYTCSVCGHRQTRRMHVDHAIGVRKDPTHRYLRVLCPSCHDIKTTMERRTRRVYTKSQVWALLRMARQHQVGTPSKEVVEECPLPHEAGKYHRRKRVKTSPKK